MRVDQFDFVLPDELIALRPASPRDAARLMVVHANGQLEHARVRDLPGFLRRGDAAVVNDSKVMHARLIGRRIRAGLDPAGARIELLLHKRISADGFSGFARPARKLAVGDALSFGDALSATVVRVGRSGEVEVTFRVSGSVLDDAIKGGGEIPLPPYIRGKRKLLPQDAHDYQTLFADRLGSIAAPTAGLHFTQELLDGLAAAGVTLEKVTLHLGAGTFLPVSVDDTSRHRMHAEEAHLSLDVARRLNRARADGGRIVAVGTTSLRTLESAADESGSLSAFSAETKLFVEPGYRFKTAEVLLTNFHLPRSTLFMLVSAFSGLETMKRAYREAIAERYRFYSYGDACLLFRVR